MEVLDALLDAGADIEAPGAVLGGGPPLADATGFGQWQSWERMTALDAAQRSGADELVVWLRARGAKSASELD